MVPHCPDNKAQIPQQSCKHLQGAGTELWQQATAADPAPTPSQNSLFGGSLFHNAGDEGSIPGSGRSPGEGNGNPLQYSCLENYKDRGV